MRQDIYITAAAPAPSPAGAQADFAAGLRFVPAFFVVHTGGRSGNGQGTARGMAIPICPLFAAVGKTGCGLDGFLDADLLGAVAFTVCCHFELFPARLASPVR